VIAVDTNLLVYAHREDSPIHSDAKDAVETLRQGTAPWAIPWPCVHEFIGIVTHPRIYRPPSSLAKALGFLDSLIASPQLTTLAESHGYFEKLRLLSSAGKVKGPRVHDCRIAALCLHHGVNELWSADRDFSAFPKLTTGNPLTRE
jgi:toxin-antitoxin system PIN domain toxin